MLATGKRPRIVQTGIYEKLLCAECENGIGEYDRYASQILKHDKNLIIEQYSNAGVLKNVNYSLFKLFQMSILWRAGGSGRPEF